MRSAAWTRRAPIIRRIWRAASDALLLRAAALMRRFAGPGRQTLAHGLRADARPLALVPTRAWSSCGLHDVVKRRRLDGEGLHGVSAGWRLGGSLIGAASRRALHSSAPRLRAELAQPAKQGDVAKSQSSAPTNVHAEDAKERRRRDIEIMRKLLPNIWPKGETGAKFRVVLALGFLVAGKVRSVVTQTG